MEKNNFLFEISWEVCNKVGGIHTVIASKTKTMLKHIDNYFAIGPYLDNSYKEFTEEDIPKEFQNVFDELKNIGIEVHYGTWNIEGRPKTLLIDSKNFSYKNDEVKGKLWELYQVDSLNSNWYDFDSAILWSWSCGIVIDKLIELLKQTNNNQSEFFVHSHEWMAGGAIFYLKSLENRNEDKKDNKSSNIYTVFTTHATMLGRTLCGNGTNIYDIKNKIDANKMAYEYGVHTKHQSEKALAHIADCFTTVSQITAKEAEYFYSKKPDVLLYNGFDDDLDFEFATDFSVIHKKFRENINRFIEKYFFDYYKFDLNKTKVFYTSGRNEFRNKGVDLYIKSLSELNKKLKKENSDTIVVNLFLIPVGEFDIDERFIKSQDNTNKENNTNNDKIDLLDFAPLSTHNIPMDNQIIKAFVNSKLLNNENDNVKVVLMPIYLDGKDKILKTDYYSTIMGLDLGIFPSYYEPWGYTPLESISYGVETVTSDLAGFGRTILRDYKEINHGVKIIKREQKTDEESIIELYRYMFEFLNTPEEVFLKNKDKAIEFAKKFSWNIFIKNYMKAYNIAESK